MTNSDLQDYYAQLLILQYLGKPRADATVRAWASAVIMNQLPTQVQDGFDVTTAVGPQLDILGKYVGAFRNSATHAGPVVLIDDDFRKLIKLAIIKNNSGSSLSTIQTLIAANFPGEISISDNQAMGLNYVVKKSFGTDTLLEVLAFGGYLPAPMGVQVSVVFSDVLDSPVFGFRTYDAPDPTVTPFNNYFSYQLNYHWFSYQDA